MRNCGDDVWTVLQRADTPSAGLRSQEGALGSREMLLARVHRQTGPQVMVGTSDVPSHMATVPAW
jgi:hypothetical protein